MNCAESDFFFSSGRFITSLRVGRMNIVFEFWDFIQHELNFLVYSSGQNSEMTFGLKINNNVCLLKSFFVILLLIQYLQIDNSLRIYNLGSS